MAMAPKMLAGAVEFIVINFLFVGWVRSGCIDSGS
jgi:hypothetical protein